MMLPEYVYKVGDMFVEGDYPYNDSIHLTGQQHKATRFGEEGARRIATRMDLYHVPYVLYRIDGGVRKATLSTKKDETVS